MALSAGVRTSTEGASLAPAESASIHGSQAPPALDLSLTHETQHRLRPVRDVEVRRSWPGIRRRFFGRGDAALSGENAFGRNPGDHRIPRSSRRRHRRRRTCGTRRPSLPRSEGRLLPVERVALLRTPGRRRTDLSPLFESLTRRPPERAGVASKTLAEPCGAEGLERAHHGPRPRRVRDSRTPTSTVREPRVN